MIFILWIIPMCHFKFSMNVPYVTKVLREETWNGTLKWFMKLKSHVTKSWINEWKMNFQWMSYMWQKNQKKKTWNGTLKWFMRWKSHVTKLCIHFSFMGSFKIVSLSLNFQKYTERSVLYSSPIYKLSFSKWRDPYLIID